MHTFLSFYPKDLRYAVRKLKETTEELSKYREQIKDEVDTLKARVLLLEELLPILPNTPGKFYRLNYTNIRIWEKW